MTIGAKDRVPDIAPHSALFIEPERDVVGLVVSEEVVVAIRRKVLATIAHGSVAASYQRGSRDDSPIAAAGRLELTPASYGTEVFTISSV